MDPDFYAILGVAADADAEQIKAAFRQLARALHPDAASGSGSGSGTDSGSGAGAGSGSGTGTGTGRDPSPERLTQVMTAWRVLHDPAKRAAYDRTRAPAVPGTTAAARPNPGPRTPDSGSAHSQPPLTAGPTVIHNTRTPPSSGPHIRVGPAIRLRRDSYD